MPIETPCEICGKIVRHKPSHKARFCSRDCQHKFQRFLPDAEPRACPTCGKVFTPIRKRWMQKFCSKPCGVPHWQAASKTQEVVEKRAIATGNAQRRKGCKDTYVKYRGRHEHRVVMEKHLGRKLTFQDVVHHIDGNKKNNAIENLELTTRQKHMPIHGLGIPGKPLAHKPWLFRKKKK